MIIPEKIHLSSLIFLCFIYIGLFLLPYPSQNKIRSNNSTCISLSFVSSGNKKIRESSTVCLWKRKEHSLKILLEKHLITNLSSHHSVVSPLWDNKHPEFPVDKFIHALILSSGDKVASGWPIPDLTQPGCNPVTRIT